MPQNGVGVNKRPGLYFQLVLPQEVGELIEDAKAKIADWGKQTKIEICPKLPILSLETYSILYNMERNNIWGLVVVQGKASKRIQGYIYPVKECQSNCSAGN